jgi:hypothetical protein
MFGSLDNGETQMYRWIDEAGDTVSSHSTLESAGRHHRRMCRADIRCIDTVGKDLTGAAIYSSYNW